MTNNTHILLSQVDIGTDYNLGYGKPLSSNLKELSSLIVPLSQNIMLIAGIIFFLLLVVGGLKYIQSAGNGDKEGAEKSKQALTAAVLGFIIIFASYWIILIIEYVTGTSILNSGY